MRRLALLGSHLAALVVGFVVGVYALPILIAPAAPSAQQLASLMGPTVWTARFRRDLKDSDALHWGDGEVAVGPKSISLVGRLAPGPDYKLYLSPEFVETEADFRALKSRMVRCATTREIAAAASGTPYVPSDAERKAGSAPSKFTVVPPAEGKAVVYFFRTSQLVGAVRAYGIHMNDADMGALDSGAYRRIEVAPGHYRLKVEPTWMAWANPALLGDLSVAAGEVRFVRVRIGATQVAGFDADAPAGLRSGLWRSNGGLVEMSEASAKDELGRLSENH